MCNICLWAIFAYVSYWSMCHICLYIYVSYLWCTRIYYSVQHKVSIDLLVTSDMLMALCIRAYIVSHYVTTCRLSGHQILFGYFRKISVMQLPVHAIHAFLFRFLHTHTPVYKMCVNQLPAYHRSVKCSGGSGDRGFKPPSELFFFGGGGPGPYPPLKNSAPEEFVGPPPKCYPLTSNICDRETKGICLLYC